MFGMTHDAVGHRLACTWNAWTWLKMPCRLGDGWGWVEKPEIFEWVKTPVIALVYPSEHPQLKPWRMTIAAVWLLLTRGQAEGVWFLSELLQNGLPNLKELDLERPSCRFGRNDRILMKSFIRKAIHSTSERLLRLADVKTHRPARKRWNMT